MKRDASQMFRAMTCAFCGAVFAVLAICGVMFIAAGVSVGIFAFVVEGVFRHFLGDYWYLVVMAIGAVVGAVSGFRRAMRA